MYPIEFKICVIVCNESRAVVSPRFLNMIIIRKVLVISKKYMENGKYKICLIYKLKAKKRKTIKSNYACSRYTNCSEDLDLNDEFKRVFRDFLWKKLLFSQLENIFNNL